MGVTENELKAAYERATELASKAPARVDRRMDERVLTFIDVPSVDLQQGVDGLDAVVLGVPYEGIAVKDPRTFHPRGSSPPPGSDLYSRRGTYEAPRAVRHASVFYSLDHSNGYMPEYGLRLGERLRIADAGDLPLRDCRAEEAFEITSEAVEQIVRAGAVPLVIGGDHVVPLFVLAGIFAATGKRIGVITYDSHFDLAREPRFWEGSQWAHLMELGALAPKNFVPIGIRGLRNAVLWDHVTQELGIPYFTMADVDRLGLEEVNRRALEHARDGTDLLYVSLDVDAFEPVFCPAQTHPESGGFTAREMLRSLGQVASEGICGFDICCLGPAHDVQFMGCELAARCLVEVLAAMAASRSSA